jgi:hypothetical protein
MVRIYIIGLSILIIAILLNVLVQALGIMGWYEFLTKLQEQGRKVFSVMSILDYAWLFVLYPFLLGLAYLLGERIHHLIFD